MDEDKKTEQAKIGSIPEIPLPIPIEIVSGSIDHKDAPGDRLKNLVDKGNKTLAPNTTEEQDIVTAGQRTINLMWERTQSLIAIWAVLTNIIINSTICMIVIVFKIEITVNQMAVITLCLQPISLTTGIVIGFYFSRTNHTKIGGVGPKQGDR